MKIRANRAELAEALTWVAQAISKRPSHAALSGIRLTACDGELEMHAFDYDVSHFARVDVEVQDDGECLVSGHFLREIISALKGEAVQLVLDGQRLEITSGRSTYRVSTLNAEDYPTLPAFPKVCGQVARDDFADVLATVEHAAGRDSLIPTLTAAHLVGGVEMLSAITTDRFRIAHRETVWSASGPEGTFEANVPITALTTALKGMSGVITIGHDGGVFGIADGRRKVTSRCIDDSFPKVEQFLGVATAAEVEVNARDLADAVKRAALATADHQIVRLAIGTDEIAVTADSDTSDGAEYVECAANTESVIYFNGGYLAAALLAAGSDLVRLGFTSESVKPVSLTPVDGERIDLLVMPRRAS